MRHRVFDRWTILTLLGVGAFMFWGAGHYSVFDDEGFSCRRYTMPMGEMISALWCGEEPDPPLYYILQNIWVHIFGVGPLGLRSLSILMFLAGLVFTRLAATEWYDAPTGRLAMLIAAIHPAHLLFGFAGRWYSMMFCLVGLFLWLTGVLARRVDRRTLIAWSLVAAAVCYTNYFGPVLVAITWAVMVIRHGQFRRWLPAAAITAILYAPWLPAFWKQATTFPQVTLTWSKYGDSALRLLMALFTGNLASISAWWVWVFVFVSMVAFSLLAIFSSDARRRPGPMPQIIALCVFAGIASRTIIDKYIMVFSGLVCIGVAAIWIRYGLGAQRSWPTRFARLATASLALAWVGCYINLVTERHWSSLRWLDPWEHALNSLKSNGPTEWVMSQPAARYYYGCKMAPFEWREYSPLVMCDGWRWFALPPDQGGSHEAPATPESILEKMKERKPPRVATIRGSEFSDSPKWSDLEKILDKEYELVEERAYLEDLDAKWKDWLDPTFKHPEWRVTFRVYKIR
ncbi:MAG TPA: hypothetical protein VJZ71_12200 [Phycisphaerae bacterium]|nr:hypothetical protein [Phycisphaerae bacterium]